MPRMLSDLYVFIVTNEAGDEGVASYLDPRTKRLEPMLAVTEEKREALMEVAHTLVSLHPESPIRIVRFSEREDIAEVVPAAEDAS